MRRKPEEVAALAVGPFLGVHSHSIGVSFAPSADGTKVAIHNVCGKRVRKDSPRRRAVTVVDRSKVMDLAGRLNNTVQAEKNFSEVTGSGSNL